MAEITAAAVKDLRDRTGAGMMDCKKALIESDGDQERAIDLLRKTGVAKAVKRSGRVASEGMIHIATRDRSISMVEVLSETDFVARSESFTEFSRTVAEGLFDFPISDGEILAGDELLGVEGGEEINSQLDDLRAQVGENIQVGRAIRYDPAADSAGASYVHFGNKIGVLVEVSSVSAEAIETARNVAMHVAATNPSGLDPDDIPRDQVERERAVLIEQAEEEGKPVEITEKIVEGRMRKFFEENALLWQSYVRDPEKKVKDLLTSSDEEISVNRFVRFEVGS